MYDYFEGWEGAFCMLGDMAEDFRDFRVSYGDEMYAHQLDLADLKV